ncbi:DUF1697 domain-containing protein [Maribacter sp. HTCC2170]|uniref:DUF1697 domain-containing protein n=1 Tax=Maribacter sp. (strain HTCC2170 / KCCM 42371) TaxID=313603 RepID=UPI00006AE644|nr:DUF1697 domain-containing protein [Maribacter sp. HTCC2170]EAR00471.1 hypothetical protein FB2170_08199 [Maribacter sp. HTCC2170]
MTTYIALLRGINVGGHKKIKMADLRSILEDSGLERVRTYIQSGNVVFDSEEKNTQNLEIQISETIKEHYDFEVPVLIKTRNEILRVLEDNPYTDRNELSENKIYFVLLQDSPEEDKVKELSNYKFENETFTYTPNCVYLRCALGAGKAKCGIGFFESKLKVSATSRNYRTLQKLIELSSN